METNFKRDLLVHSNMFIIWPRLGALTTFLIVKVGSRACATAPHSCLGVGVCRLLFLLMQLCDINSILSLD